MSDASRTRFPSGPFEARLSDRKRMPGTRYTSVLHRRPSRRRSPGAPNPSPPGRVQKSMARSRHLACWAPLLFVLLSGGCSRSPVEPEDVVVVVQNAARFEGISVELVKYNFSWYPRDDSPPPPEGFLFVTVQLIVGNESDRSRSIEAASFLWRTLAPGRPGEGPTWSSTPAGRSPRLVDGELQPGEAMEGWLTFRVPRDEYADQVVWQPRRGVKIAFDIPLSQATPRFDYRGTIFGRVTSPAGTGVANAAIVLTLVDPSYGDSVVGACVGAVQAASQLTTDPSGWYEAAIQLPSGSRLCVHVQVFPPEDSGLGASRISGGTLITAQPSPDREPPELRVDATLPLLN